VDVLKREIDAVLQLVGLLILGIGLAIISIAVSLIVLGSFVLAYGIIREVVRIMATPTEDAEDDGLR
jgi:hypothetical protein